MDNLLMIFVKEPKAGLVKTRLAKDIGYDMAAKVYKALLMDVVRNVKDGEDYTSRILCTPESDIDNLRELLFADDIHYQQGDTLTHRLSCAFERAFEEGRKKVVAIGSDSPFIDSGLINKSMMMLDDDDCILGPAKDGGYYLIGLKKYDKKVFKGISWSTDKVFSQTMARLEDLFFSCSVMDKMIDIDVKDDLLRLKENYDDLPGNKKILIKNLHNVLKLL